LGEDLTGSVHIIPRRGDVVVDGDEWQRLNAQAPACRHLPAATCYRMFEKHFLPHTRDHCDRGDYSELGVNLVYPVSVNSRDHELKYLDPTITPA
jgi:hypothetical protein